MTFFLASPVHRPTTASGGEAEPGERHAASPLHYLPVDVVAVALHQALGHVATVEEEVAHRRNSRNNNVGMLINSVHYFLNGLVL